MLASSKLLACPLNVLTETADRVVFFNESKDVWVFLSLVHLLPFCFFFPASSTVTHLCWTCSGSNPRIVNCRANRGLRKVQSPSCIETDILNLVDCNHNKAHLLYHFISFKSYCFVYNWLWSISSRYAAVKPVIDGKIKQQNQESLYMHTIQYTFKKCYFMLNWPMLNFILNIEWCETSCMYSWGQGQS